MPPLTTDTAVELLFARADAELETESGAHLPVRRVAMLAEGIRATAPRLQVAEGMALLGRVIGEDGAPWRVHFRVERASVATPELADVHLSVQGVELDPTRRRTPRVPVGGIAWLVAVNCQAIVDGDRVDGSIVDLSRGGMAFATGGSVRRGDRLRLNGRFFADAIDAEVRVQSVRPSSSPGRVIAGCQFLEADATLHAQIDRIMSPAERSARSSVDVGSLRDALTVEEKPGWKRILRRG